MIYCPECGAELKETWKDVQGLHTEIARLKRDFKNALVWIAALIKLQGGTVRVPVDLLVSLGNGFEVERWHDSLRACEVFKVKELKEPPDDQYHAALLAVKEASDEQ